MRKIIGLIFFALVVITGRMEVQSDYLEIDEIRRMVSAEVVGMKEDPDFYLPYNLFYQLCPTQMRKAMESLFMNQEDDLIFCKMIENAAPEYFMGLLLISPEKTPKILSDVIK